MSEDTKLPELPLVDQGAAIGYHAIRYVPGWPESYVKQYAIEYARQAAEAERERCIAFLMDLHDFEVSHNHFHWAANQLRERGTK
jgi:hypothetical protein